MPEKPQAYAPGVYGLMGGVNQFVLDDPQGGITVIDGGLPGSTRRLLQLIQEIGRTPQDVHTILITHADIDHVGDLKALVKATGAQVIASAPSQQYIQHRRTPPHLRFPYSLFAGTVGFLLQRAVPVDQIVSAGETLNIAGGIQVIATPGHTPDHISYFWERERVLFVGDLLRNMGGRLSLTPAAITHDMDAARSSTRRVLALEPAWICPGHGLVWSAAQSPEQIEALRAATA